MAHRHYRRWAGHCQKVITSIGNQIYTVSCHRVKDTATQWLVWVVGNRKKFGEQGLVAVNRTKRNILHSEWENNWHFLQGLQLMATLAGLLHDIGKSSDGFQYKLHHRTPIGDPIGMNGCRCNYCVICLPTGKTDKAVFRRLQNLSEYLTKNPLVSYPFDDKNIQKSHINHLPPLAQWLAWLVVTHHRLPLRKILFWNLYKTP